MVIDLDHPEKVRKVKTVYGNQIVQLGDSVPNSDYKKTNTATWPEVIRRSNPQGLGVWTQSLSRPGSQ